MASTCDADGCERKVASHGWCLMHWKRVQRNGAPLLQTQRPRRDPAARFWEKVDTSAGPNECWPWMAARDALGYGFFRLVPSENMLKAHRVAWRLTHGAIPAGLHVCHACDNPQCCNPAHLMLGTHQANMADRNAKRRTTKGNIGHHGEGSGRAAKLTLDQVKEIRQIYGTETVSQNALGERYGISQTQVGRIIRGVRWAHD